MIRFLLDEHVPHAIAHGLRLRGVDVLTANEANLLATPDEQIVEYALNNQLVIFTQDDDFLSIASTFNHGGIVYSKQGKRSIGEIVQFLKLLSECLEVSEMANRVEYY